MAASVSEVVRFERTCLLPESRVTDAFEGSWNLTELVCMAYLMFSRNQHGAKCIRFEGRHFVRHRSVAAGGAVGRDTRTTKRRAACRATFCLSDLRSRVISWRREG